MKFITITLPNGDSADINPHAIKGLFRSKETYGEGSDLWDKTYVDMGGDGYRVRETIDEIRSLIADTEEVR